jgi:hypothetical protein
MSLRPHGIGIGDTKALENVDFAAFHPCGVGLLLVIVAHEMQGPVNDQMRPVGVEGYALLVRLTCNQWRTDGKIAKKRLARLRIGHIGWE